MGYLDYFFGVHVDVPEILVENSDSHEIYQVKSARIFTHDLDCYEFHMVDVLEYHEGWKESPREEEICPWCSSTGCDYCLMLTR